MPDFDGLRCTVMGLGVHGGGLAAACYLAERGARVTVTDLRSEDQLASSLERLPPTVRTVLGTHEREDFRAADLVVKNPAVPRGVPMLREAQAVTTDIALFLADWRRRGDGPLVAITGTKGKSSTSSAVAHILQAWRPRTRLGGNITVSPLTFVDELESDDPVVLELSSFQLGDMAFCRAFNASRPATAARRGIPDEILTPTLPARVAVITNIFRDHQDYYESMEDYVADKREIYAHLPADGVALFGARDEWDESFARECRRRYGDARVAVVGPGDDRLVPERLLVPGAHNRQNVRFAARAARTIGMPEDLVRMAAASFPGVPHRLEVVVRTGRLAIVNDSAATIPEAARAAVAAFPGPVILIAGGSDKGLDPAPIVDAADAAIRRGGAVVLLAGTATDGIVSALQARQSTWHGPFPDLPAAMERALDLAASAQPATAQPATAQPATAQPATDDNPPVVLLSPGCASFGMFRNEFDRGDQFRELARSLIR